MRLVFEKQIVDDSALMEKPDSLELFFKKSTTKPSKAVFHFQLPTVSWVGRGEKKKREK